jgi:hypothetical protein
MSFHIQIGREGINPKRFSAVDQHFELFVT